MPVACLKRAGRAACRKNNISKVSGVRRADC